MTDDRAALAHAYAVLVANDAAIPRDTLAAITERARPYLPFDVTERRVWLSANERVAVLGLAGRGAVDLGSSWHECDGGVVSFSGLPVRRSGWWRKDSSWAQQMSDMLATAPLDRVSADAFGVFTMLALGADGDGSVVSDPLGVATLYRADGPRWSAVASRASLAGIAAFHPEPLRHEIDALGWLLSFDNVVGDGTGYTGVRALPARSQIDVRRGAIRVTATPVRETASTPDEHRDASSAEICDHLRAAAEAPNPRVGLTGGKDSRLVLSHLLAAGVSTSFQYVTWDLNSSDVTIATDLARRYGLDHTVISVDPPASWLDAARAALHRMDGMLPGTEVGKVISDPGVLVTGGAGGLFATVYGTQRAIRSFDDVRAIFSQRVRRSDDQTLCTAGAIERFGGELDEIVESYASHHPEHVPVLFYLDQRLHRWQGSVREAAPRADVMPLLSPRTLAGALATPHDARRERRWHRQLWETAAPDLSAAPMSDGYARDVQPGGSWHGTATLASQVLLSDPTNPVFDVIDRAKLERLVTSDEAPSQPLLRKQLINAIGLALWARAQTAPLSG